MTKEEFKQEAYEVFVRHLPIVPILPEGAKFQIDVRKFNDSMAELDQKVMGIEADIDPTTKREVADWIRDEYIKFMETIND